MEPNYYTMDRPMLNGAIERMLLTYFNFDVAYKVGVVVMLVWLLYSITFKPKKQIIFPIWATIEVALTGYIISKGGVSQSI